MTKWVAIDRWGQGTTLLKAKKVVHAAQASLRAVMRGSACYAVSLVSWFRREDAYTYAAIISIATMHVPSGTSGHGLVPPSGPPASTPEELGNYLRRGLKPDGSKYPRSMREGMKMATDARNNIHQARRDAGESEVSEDEPDMIELTPPPSRPTTPVNNTDVAALTAILAELSPSSRKGLAKDYMCSLKPSRRRRSSDWDLDSEDETPMTKKRRLEEELNIDISIDEVVGWHPRLKELMNYGEYTPASLFLNDTRRQMLDQNNNVHLRTSVGEDGKKRQMLDNGAKPWRTLSRARWRC
ncbi:hypothetical protein OE88DRAFT_1644904 [Heliocybe sulcata]|uniref:Uncharacterized protein n=1 Tax=Heliocybe sulcata TaxID=5364 RepID=A0A5C3N5N4_9AGAM|nr:hypothetical protein OE88DRAFT_1644904 [Heliocybe sulcata]